MEVLKNHKGKVLASVCMAVIGVAFGVLPYFAVANIIGSIVARNPSLSHYLIQIGLVLLGFLGGILFHEMSTITSHRLAYFIIEDKRKMLAEKLSRISMGEVEKKSSGQWSQFMVETLDKMEKPIAHVIPEVIANVLIPLVLVIIIFILDWRMGIANLLSVPLGILFYALTLRGYEAKSRRYQEASKAMNTTMVEYVNGIKVIKAFHKSASSFGKFQDTVNENKQSMLDWYLSVCFSMTAAMEIIPATMLFVLPASLLFFLNGSIRIGRLVMCILLSYAAYKPLLKAMGHMETIANLRVTIDEIKKVMELPELKRGSEQQKIASHNVEFQNVSFSYEEEKKVLNSISFTAKEKELTAIVGDSGGGKSTIVKLIAGFWNVDGGDILIGGSRLSDMPLQQNMELVTYVSQESFLFNKTVLENLRMAKEDASMEEVIEVCKKASCHDFIMSLPEGYETVVGEGGASLSGGERQRIAIARCFLKNSPIVLLDEATAYSDPDNEAIIQKSINGLVKDKTVIMIAHRLSTIINANQILVVDRGQIIEQGRHQDLLAQSGKYKEMWDAYTESKQIEVI